MPRHIKRYDNRKLYDTETSEYVSLSDLAELVRRGETVEVTDNATGEDITAQTLTQIILEEGRSGREVIPSELLHDLLRKSGEAIDSGLDQIRSTVDDLFHGSVDQLSRLVQDPRRQEYARLQQQLQRLEQRLSDLLDDLEDRANPSATPQANDESASERAERPPAIADE